MRFLCGTCVAVFAVWCAAGSASGAEGPASSEQVEFFEKRIRPVLVEHCYECHAAGANELGGGLRLDSRDGWRRGGDSGPAIAPGKAEESLLVRAVGYDDDALKMPPKGKLKAEVIADLRRWIADGAVDPRAGEPPQAAAKSASWDETLAARRQWWSLQPVRRPEVPPAADAATGDHPIDRFLAVRRQTKSLELAEPADPYALVRRLGLVLTGLPPTADDAEAFARSYPPSLPPSVSPSPAKDRGTDGQRDGEKSYEAVVDGLLASPAFGERWARHWLDVVRFSETHGNEWNYEVHHAWRYRDYVVRAFNADLPYDQFVREHVAGDLLENPRRNADERFNESVIGTAFYRFGEVAHDD